MSAWIVVSDFDGTLSRKDVGNELCKEVLGETFFEIHRLYKKGGIDLRAMQQKVWQNFPLSEARFLERSLHYGELRPGVNEFLEHCLAHAVPVYVASCGLRPYIEVVLKQNLTPPARAAIKGLRCNEARFDHEKIAYFAAPDAETKSAYPLDKGAWCNELRAQHPGAKVLAIGNGTSDYSFAGHVDRLAATEGLATWCTQKKIPFEPFEDFRNMHELLR